LYISIEIESISFFSCEIPQGSYISSKAEYLRFAAASSFPAAAYGLRQNELIYYYGFQPSLEMDVGERTPVLTGYTIKQNNLLKQGLELQVLCASMLGHLGSEH